MNFQKKILILKPRNAEDALESDALELFNRDAWMHILKCKHDQNRNNILKNRLAIKQHAKSNPYLDDIVKRYDDYYEGFKNKIMMQIGALERLLKYLKDLELSNSETINGVHHRHYHNHNHYYYDDSNSVAAEDDSNRNHDDDDNFENENEQETESVMNRKIPSAVVSGIKKNQKLIFKEIKSLKNLLQIKGMNREAKYKELSKYIDKIDDETNKTDSNLFKIKKEQEQILQTLGRMTKNVRQSNEFS
jgi:hypothetical protein